MITETEIIAALRTHHLFHSLSDSDFQQLVQQSQLHRLDVNQVLFHQGDSVDCFYFVFRGRVRLSRLAPSGHEKHVELISTGKSFAEALMFSERPAYPVSAIALEPSDVVALPCRHYKQLLMDKPDLCFSLLTQMSQRLHSQLNEIENLSLQNAQHRLVNYLLQKVDSGNELTLELPKRILASQLAIQPETLSRLLKKLSKAGVIHVYQNNVSLLDKDALYAMASDNQPLRSQ